MFSSSSSPISIPNTKIHPPEPSIFTTTTTHHNKPTSLQFLPLSFPLLKSTKISCLPNPDSSPKLPPLSTKRFKTTPPRDMIIDFGKYKGKMLGSLPSSYLKWVSKNLLTGEFEEWSKLADQVLQDPIYNDRIEWEFADRIMKGDASILNKSDIDPAKEIMDLFERFGWDNKDDWSKVDFELLGTSYGGRLPRIDRNKINQEEEREKERKREKEREERERLERIRNGEASAREKRRERIRMKRSGRASEGRMKVVKLGVDDGGGGGGGDDVERDEKRTDEIGSKELPKFPGRDSLYKKAIDYESQL